MLWPGTRESRSWIRLLAAILSSPYLMAMLSGLLIALAFLFPRVFFLMWFAFVPLLAAVREARSGRAYVLGLLAGVVMSSSASYWIDDFIFNLKGYDGLLRTLLAIIFWILSAQVLAVLTLLYCWFSKVTRFSPLLVFPALLCLLFAFFPSMFPVQLGASQSQFLIALQAIEFTGVYGLDFILALANILIFTLFVDKRSGSSTTPVVVSMLVLVLWFAYGVYALPRWDSEIASLDTMKVGVVQTNDQPSVKMSPPSAGFSYAYPKEMAYSQVLAEAGAQVIIWPEARHRGYFSHPHVAEAFRFYAKQFAVALVFQDSESERERGRVRRFNTSVLMSAEGEEAGKYRKIKRIPIGEYLPLLQSSDWAKRSLRAYVGDFFSDLEAGKSSQVYRLNTSQNSFAIPLICYELIFPRFVAEAIPALQAPTFLIGQSNNSWFGKTRQPFQHLHTAVMRSVENRLPLVYTANNGPSALISPSGRILAQTNFNQDAAYLFALPLHKATEKTLFGRYTLGFLSLSAFVLLLCLIDALFTRIRARVAKAC